MAMQNAVYNHKHFLSIFIKYLGIILFLFFYSLISSKQFQKGEKHIVCL